MTFNNTHYVATIKKYYLIVVLHIWAFKTPNSLTIMTKLCDHDFALKIYKYNIQLNLRFSEWKLSSPAHQCQSQATAHAPPRNTGNRPKRHHNRSCTSWSGSDAHAASAARGSTTLWATHSLAASARIQEQASCCRRILSRRTEHTSADLKTGADSCNDNTIANQGIHLYSTSSSTRAPPSN